jgi:hypothetical protein
VLKRGHETFAGEAQLQFVTAAETYTEYLTRVKGYKRLLQLFNRDRDLTSPMLAGLGSTPVDEKVRTCVQANTFLLPARDRTPQVIERMVMQALDAVTDVAEAVRQASIKQLADAYGLGVSAFFEQKRPQPSGTTKLRLSDVKPGLQRPAEGWGDSLEVIARKVGPGPNDLARCTQARSARFCTPTPCAGASAGARHLLPWVLICSQTSHKLWTRSVSQCTCSRCKLHQRVVTQQWPLCCSRCCGACSFSLQRTQPIQLSGPLWACSSISLVVTAVALPAQGAATQVALVGLIAGHVDHLSVMSVAGFALVSAGARTKNARSCTSTGRSTGARSLFLPQQTPK